MKFLLFLTLFSFSLSLNAMTIKSIKYQGMLHISENVALRMLDFNIGDEVDAEDIDNAIKKYFKQKYFNDIWADYENGKLTFNFVEKAIISQINLEGWKETDSEDVMRSVIQIQKGALYNKAKVEAAKKRIIEAIAQEGKIDSVVEIEKELLNNGSIKLTFVVREGEKIIITKLNYTGVKGLDSDDFDDVIANKENEWLGWLFGRNDGEMDLSNLEYDNVRIRDYYMQNGYLDAQVKPAFTKVDFNTYTAEMNYDIEEGSVYKIKSIAIYQAEDVIEDEKINEIITLKEGDVFNIATFRENSKAIKTLIADLSYAFVEVIPDLRKNKEDNTVDVVFKIIPGTQVRIRDIIISGNTRTLDRIIRRELYLGAGDKYSLSDLKDSKNALGRLGFFDSTTIEEKRITHDTIDLVVKVTEAATGNVQVGGGYGSYGGMMITFGVSDQNIFGSGINVGMQVEKSETTRNTSFNISNNRLNDSDFSGNFSIHASTMDYYDYIVKSRGVSIGTGHRFSRYISGSIGYGYSDNSYDLSDFNSTYLDRRFLESYSKGSVTLSVKYDSTDDYYLPREGFSLSQSLEKAGLAGSVDFIKTRTELGIFRGLEDYLGFDAIARYKARYFYLTSSDGYIPLAEKFYMGGIGSVRGYQSYSISPMLGEERVGGSKTFSHSVEMSFPLIPKAKMRLVSFLDYGIITGHGQSLSRAGYGLGIEWMAPIGPVQIMFAQPLGAKEGDQTSAFEFTMGRRF